MKYLKEFINQKKSLSEERLKKFIYAEKSYILPQRSSKNNDFLYSNLSSEKITLTESSRLYDKTYKKLNKLLQCSISSKPHTEETLLIHQFENEELRKMTKYQKYMDVKRKIPVLPTSLSMEENFLKKLMDFENSKSYRKKKDFKLLRMKTKGELAKNQSL